MGLMKPGGASSVPRLLLGIEGGGTRTVAVLADGNDRLLQRLELGPANAKLLSDRQLVHLFRAIRKATQLPSALGIGLAGARNEEDRARIRALAEGVWTGVPCVVSHDLDTALTAAEEKDGQPCPEVLVLCGTGSCCYGRTRDGRSVRAGGWGHLIGDRGSGFEIGLRALQLTALSFDQTGRWPALGQRLLRALQLNEPCDLIGWAQGATKAEIAALAVEVFDGWGNRDGLAARILDEAASRLVQDALSCAERLAGPRQHVRFVLAGGVLLKQPRFARQVRRRLLQRWPQGSVDLLRRESVWGAVTLAQRCLASLTGAEPSRSGTAARRQAVAALPQRVTPAVASRCPSPTEARNPRSMRLDRLSVAAAIELMLSEDEKIPAAIRAQRRKIERAVGLIVRALRSGGRLFYVGAGTSGRLGVLDASECPPTFRTPPQWVQGIIAGGQSALWRSIERAEDDPQAGAAAVEFRGVGANDVLLGIAASGLTPFVWGALGEAHRRRAVTILLCFNPYLVIPRARRPTLVIAPNVGPEILTGSTRLKAGTATKLILNILTTVAMVRLGKVVSNLMVDLNPSNTKLQDRATRILQALTGVDYAHARAALETNRWIVKSAWHELNKSRQS